MALQSRAAVLHDAGRPLVIEEVEFDALGEHEVLVEVHACGVCHTDVHVGAAGSALPMPAVLGHEGAGVVQHVGDSVSRLRVGDHVVTSLHACGRCRMCAAGRMHLCEAVPPAASAPGAHRAQLHLADGTTLTRFAAGAFCSHAVVHEDALVVVDDDLPLDLASLLACGVSTGWGAAVQRAKVVPGEVVAVWGVGGVGIAAVAGAAHAGASRVIAVDTLPWKTEQAVRHGATHEVIGQGLTPDELRTQVQAATGPRGADVVVIAAGSLTKELFGAAYASLGRGGRLVTVSAAAAAMLEFSGTDLNVGEKTIMGSLMGSASPRTTIPHLVDLHRAGKLDLEAFVTKRYPLDDINDAWADLAAGKNVRGVVTLM